MGDGLKLPKDKRHRSSSSIAGAGLEGTRSERKLDIRALIPEVDDHFALAETRCDDLQDKIDLVKVLKRKKKLNKRSMTRMSEQPTGTENVPLITVRTQPKRKVTQQAARLRRLELPQNPTRGYLDPATVEQHRMLGQVWGYGQHYGQVPQPPRQPAVPPDPTWGYLDPATLKQHQMLKEVWNHGQKYKKGQPDQKLYSKTHPRRTHADGDGRCGQSVPISGACGLDDAVAGKYSAMELYDQEPQFSVDMDSSEQAKALGARRRNYSTRDTLKEVPKWIDSTMENARPQRGRIMSPNLRRQRQQQQQQPNIVQPSRFRMLAAPRQPEERPVVELFNKSRPSASSGTTRLATPQQDTNKEDKRTGKPRDTPKYTQPKPEEEPRPAELKKGYRLPRRLKYRSRNYELPTVASQMKQTDIRYHNGSANRSKIPFVVSKSTAPSHNIGVNIQQVLNGVKVQQPLNGIPLTIAHHMGLGHVPTSGTKSETIQPSLNNREINAIKLGRRLLMLPSYKYISFNRLLSLYREGEGMVPRFLRAISRPNYFYTSMYNLAPPPVREEQDGATSKGRGGGGEGSRRGTTARDDVQARNYLITEYYELSRKFEEVAARLRQTRTPELERRYLQLQHDLDDKREVLKKILKETNVAGFLGMDVSTDALRASASASAAEQGCRHSTFKLNAEDPPQ